MIDHSEILRDLSPTAQLLRDADQDTISDIIQIIKRAELRKGLTPFSILIELRKALFYFRLNHPESSIVDIDIGADSIGFQVYNQVVDLTVDDIKKLANAPVA